MSQENETTSKLSRVEDTKVSDLFSEVLQSGGQIEGLFEKKRREEMQANAGKKSNKKRGTNGLKDPASVLKERLAIYNKKNDEEFHLHLANEDLSYSGLLIFHYHNGYQLLSENVKVRNSYKASDLIPILLRRFLPQYEFMSVSSEVNNSYIALTQNGTERELDLTEKPLEIALDCSTKGRSPPVFTLKTSLSLLLNSSSPRKHSGSKLSSLSLTTSSMSSLGHVSSDGSESPHVVDNSPQVTMDDYECLYNYGNTSYQSNTHPSSKSKSFFKSRSQTQKLMLQKLHSEPNLLIPGSPMTPPGTSSHQLTPEMARKAGRHKSKVGNFVEGVARSLKSKRKYRPTSIYPEGGSTEIPDPGKSALVSPNMAEKQFSMPTVFHIYYSHARNTQLYKSVLVSESSSTKEVIKQALERYGMKFVNPDEFSLFEVVGRWEAIDGSIDSNLERSFGGLITPEGSQDNTLFPKQRPVPAFEEFFVCYTRELDITEKPYEVQFFHATPSGYTRRFELRAKVNDDVRGNDYNDNLSKEMVPTTPVFGVTSHNIRDQKTSVSKNGEDTIEFVAVTEETEATNEKERKEKKTYSALLDRSLIDCSSPDSGVDIHRDRMSSKSVLISDQSYSSVSSLFPAVTSGAFLLNLQLVPSEKESLLYHLSYEKLFIRTGPSHQFRNESMESISDKSTPGSDSIQNENQVELHVPEAENDTVLCTVKKEHVKDFSSKYLLEPQSTAVPISINSQIITYTSELLHGDLIQIGHTHLFMFQNHSMQRSTVKKQNTSWPYRWQPMSTTITTEEKAPLSSVVINQNSPSNSRVQQLHISEERLSPSLPESMEVIHIDTANFEDIQTPSSPAKIVYISPREERTDVCSLPTLEEVDVVEEESGGEHLHQPHRRRSKSDSKMIHKLHSHAPLSSTHLSSSFTKQLHKDSNKLGAFPPDRKLMFSYNISEEDTLLDLLINKINPMETVFTLAPAYVLCMCMEYSIRGSSGPSVSSRLICKAIECIQETIWETTNQMMSWQPQVSKSNTHPILDDQLHSNLHNILFWMANSLELYNFLLAQDNLDLVVMIHGEKEEEEKEENALTLLENMIQHLFQQAFYPISKILYLNLQNMLEEGPLEEVQESCVNDVVELLKQVLDLILELHVHTEMVAQFFANVFFFLNGAMFNDFIDQGPQLGLYQYSTGSKLRCTLDLLEGWAGRVGFRDGALQFFTVFSSAIDLISIPPDELMKMTWTDLRTEFPSLYPAQLHFILSHYLLPEHIEEVPIQWTPTPSDARDALNEGFLRESFESHPDFELPIGGYLLDLDSQSCDNHMLNKFVDSLRKELKKKKKNVDIVRVMEDCSLPVVPTLIYSSTNTYPPSPTSPKKKPLLNISEIISPEEKRTVRLSHSKKDSKKHVKRQNMKTNSSSELRGRVKSIMEPKFHAPETLLITARNHNSKGDQNDCTTPLGNLMTGSRMICLQRGNNGFGFTTEEKKDPVTGTLGLFIQSIHPQSTVSQTSDISVGDQILAIDDFLMDGTQYEKVRQYVKDAEEEITLILATRR